MIGRSGTKVCVGEPKTSGIKWRRYLSNNTYTFQASHSCEKSLVSNHEQDVGMFKYCYSKRGPIYQESMLFDILFNCKFTTTIL